MSQELEISVQQKDTNTKRHLLFRQKYILFKY